MRFVVLDRGARIPLDPRPLAVLVKDSWDDFGWRTMFRLLVVDNRGRHDIGNVKIASLDMEPDAETVVRLPSSFTTLSDGYFSVGQDDTYYERLNELAGSTSEAVLRGLQDMALDERVFAMAQHQEVTRVSLMRSLRAHTVEGQFRRMARGGARRASFDIGYISPAQDGGDRLTLDFQVIPGQQPPSNIHVLTGRNGAGKSVLLQRLSRAVADPQADPEEVGWIFEAEAERGAEIPRTALDAIAGRSFANLVRVSFSAFDTPPLLPEYPADFPTVYVGLCQPSVQGHTPQMKSQSRLKKEFAESLDVCLGTAELHERWTAALRTLSYSGSGLLPEGWLSAYIRINPTARRRTVARRLFNSLSSGHKVVLLTMTRLVENVGERTLVLIDEPETHLHPPMLAAFVRALSDLLTDRNGLAIVATHSPVVLQEVPSDCVWKLLRHGDQFTAHRPTIETFGENVGVLTHEVFGLEVTDTGFHRDLSRTVNDGLSYQEILERFRGRLGGEARIIARSLIAARGTRSANDGLQGDH
ncbi:ATP-binding protein [Streptomyces sp. NBC_00513]|uniref:AAA family ATPase n=1 Tax=unclassified Streptomyces TaxID=2593676 RepID=UPI002250D8A1|nr:MULTISPECIES: AAA family ATPase [unclassified Streptomyces]MCX5075458.1 ATP-binding protein [Streptomyces sp. NBC_00424]MCX5152919.1 ATP-binding protein [Streptomyces sp. NBC_00291]WUD41432.1 ATP-binding protein [Streptomyces sp. NBC_00513]